MNKMKILAKAIYHVCNKEESYFLRYNTIRDRTKSKTNLPSAFIPQFLHNIAKIREMGQWVVKCLLNLSPKLYNNVFLFVGLTTLRTLNEF